MHISPTLGLPSGILGRLEGLVLLLGVEFGHEDGDDSDAAAGNDGAAARLVVRLLVAKEEVGAEPVADGGDAVGVGNQGGALGSRTRNDGGFPGELQL